jgi:hypothetical protein
VAAFVNRYFEPAWESVRPVPLIRIDFGNGTVINRTLHGNIATYVCNADGRVLDILPCIYTAKVYVNRLNQLRLLANYMGQAAGDRQEARLKDYHKRQLDALTRNDLPRVVRANPAGVTKAVIESRVEGMLVSGKQAPPGQATVGERNHAPAPKLDSREDLAKRKLLAGVTKGKIESRLETVLVSGTQAPKLDSRDLANWKLLAEDTRQNEKVRRRQVHEMLAAGGMVKPDAITKRLYKEVLHSDLDDPYLGLGKALFANYPFTDDRVR